MTGKAGRLLAAGLVGVGVLAVVVPRESVRLGAVSAVRVAADGAESWLEDKPLHGSAVVSDGDTLRIGTTKVRLFGVDAPEFTQTCEVGTEGGGTWACGAAAAARLAELVATGPVTCIPRDRDRYGRTVATCTVGGADLGAQLVAEGLARAYVRYGDDYAETEAKAKTERIGLWRGASEAPWDYRADKAAARATARPPAVPGPAAVEGEGGCQIKGNISSGGKRIYHLPGTRAYARTRIDTTRGEAWFCDEAAAQAAGFRPPGG